MTVFISLSFLALFLSGCSTHMVSMKYEPTGQIIGNAPGQASVSVGTFADERGEESNYLGAIRGGYYNPLKTLRTEKPVNQIVEVAFADALRIRNMLGTSDNSKVSIEGKITRFDCNYYLQRTSNAHLRVTVVLLPSRALIFSNIYRTENSELGWGAGIFGDTDYLALFAQKTLNETIDKALSDPGFIDAIRNPQKVNVTLSP
jgi:hypothetical protein